MKWSNEKICKFLEIYKKYNVLWNIKEARYRDRNARDKYMKELLKEMYDEGLNSNVKEVRNKIKTIKTVYSEELRKIERSKKSGAGMYEIYKPKLSWFGLADSFLRNVTVTRESALNFDTTVDDFVVEEFKAEIESESEEAAALTPKNKKTTLAVKPSKQNAPMDQVEVAIKDLSCITRATSSVPTDDELDHFGKYIATSLRKLPPINSVRCQQKIQNILTEENIALLSQI